MKADDVRAALEARHPEGQGEWVVLHEVLGIDTLAIRCWQGKTGIRFLSYEIKVSRADFRRELARPRKRARASEISHGFLFAMPWLLAQQCRNDVPVGLGLVGVLENGLTRSILKPKILPPRAWTPMEIAWLVRHRTHPPALRHALMERYERNEEIRKLRRERDEARDAAVELAIPLAAPGVMLAPQWSQLALWEVVEPPFKRDGKWMIRLRQQGGWGTGRVDEEDLGMLLANGYRFRPALAYPDMSNAKETPR